MADNKPISKDYLLTQFKNYETEIINKKYIEKEDGKSLLADTDKADYDDAVSKAHEHTNSSVLDKFSEDNEGNPLYDGKPVIDEVNVQADFLTEGGFGKLRYYNGAFQYYDETSSTWIDTSATPDNVVVMNITPNSMKSISAKNMYQAIIYVFFISVRALSAVQCIPMKTVRILLKTIMYMTREICSMKIL